LSLFPDLAVARMDTVFASNHGSESGGVLLRV